MYGRDRVAAAGISLISQRLGLLEPDRRKEACGVNPKRGSPCSYAGKLSSLNHVFTAQGVPDHDVVYLYAKHHRVAFRRRIFSATRDIKYVTCAGKIISILRSPISEPFEGFCLRRLQNGLGFFTAAIVLIFFPRAIFESNGKYCDLHWALLKCAVPRNTKSGGRKRWFPGISNDIFESLFQFPSYVRKSGRTKQYLHSALLMLARANSVAWGNCDYGDLGSHDSSHQLSPSLGRRLSSPVQPSIIAINEGTCLCHAEDIGPGPAGPNHSQCLAQIRVCRRFCRTPGQILPVVTR